NAAGLSGGVPGGTVRQQWGGAMAEGGPVTLGSLDPAGLTDLGPKPGSAPMTSHDVFAVRWQGGGGVGEPRAREPSDVVRDVMNAAVSPGQAAETSGVVVSDGGTDLRATRARRR